MAEDNHLAVAVRREFVGLMFALAAAEIGVQTYEVITCHAWKSPAPWSHLLLGTIMIASSWVGWSRAKVRGAQDQVETIWSIGFLILLMDVAIVAIYYVVVKYVEKNSPSAREEIFGACAAFGAYVVWDLLVAWRAHGGYARSVMSVVGLLLCALLLFQVGMATIGGVVACDLCLIAAILLYRAWQDSANRPTPPKLADLIADFWFCPQCRLGFIAYLALLITSYFFK